jgi:hypothetical protein
MLPGMGFLTSLRNALAGPPRIRGTGDDEPGEVAAVMHEEYVVPAPEDEGKKIEQLSEERDEQAAPAGAAPFAAAPFVSPSAGEPFVEPPADEAFATPAADIGRAREAELDEPLETLEAESEPEEDPGNRDT